ncbi:MAG: response regulator [Methanomicrobiales archaeon]|nr:response regulator [Methanomicrobiales archaeon]
MPEKAKILVVEDNAVVAMEIEENLTRMNYKVTGVAATGADAIRIAADTRPNLILMDINLIGPMDGITAAGKISAFLDVPIIYLTAYSDEPTLRRAMKTQPFSYLIKPFEERELYSNIEMALYKDKIKKRVEGDEQWLSSILRSIADPVIAADSDGVVTFVNPPAAAIIGVDAERVIGEPIQSVYRTKKGKSEPIFEEPSLRIKEKPAVVGYPMHTILLTQGNEEVPIDSTIAYVKDGEDHIIGTVIVFRKKTALDTGVQTGPDMAAVYRSILDSLGEAVAVVDVKMKVAFSNMTFEQWRLEWSPNIDAGSDAAMISEMLPSFKTLAPVFFEEAFHTNQPQLHRESVKNGKKDQIIEIRKNPLRIGGETVGIVTILRVLPR